MNTLKIISLEDCPYSMAAEDLINNIKSKSNNKINIEIQRISREVKDEFKKNNNIETFPQIYFNSRAIGGYDDLNEIYLKIKEIYSSDRNLDSMSKYLSEKLGNNSRKEILRLVEFFITGI